MKTVTIGTINEPAGPLVRHIQQSPQRQSALQAMAARYSVEPQKLLETLKSTVFKNATNEQLMTLVVVANEHGLNPFTREIYAFPDRSGGIQAVVGVDGWVRIITQHPDFDGVKFHQDDDSCTATIYVKGRSHPVEVTEYLDECRRNTDPWKSHPRRMMRHKALIQCGRIAFGYGSLKDADDVVSVDVAPPAPSFPETHTPAPQNVTSPDFTPPAEKQADKPRRGRPPGSTNKPKPEPSQDEPAVPGEVVYKPQSSDGALSPNEQLAARFDGAGITFSDLVAWNANAEAFEIGQDADTFDDLGPAVVRKIATSFDTIIESIWQEGAQ